MSGNKKTFKDNVFLMEHFYITSRSMANYGVSFIWDSGQKKHKDKIKYFENIKNNKGVLLERLKNDPVVGLRLPNPDIDEQDLGSVDSFSSLDTADFYAVDPRGFTYRINMGAIHYLMLNATIRNGVVETPCVMVEYYNNIYPVPVGSDIYKNAAKNSERISKKSSIRDLKVGDYFTAKDGQKCLYLGRFFGVYRERDVGNNVIEESQAKVFFTPKKKIFFAILNEKNEWEAIKGTTRVDIATIEGSSGFNEKTVELEINKQFQQGVTYQGTHLSYSHDLVGFISSHSKHTDGEFISNVSLDCIGSPSAEFIKDNIRHNSMILTQMPDQTFYTLDQYILYNCVRPSSYAYQNTVALQYIEVEELKKGIIKREIVEVSDPRFTSSTMLWNRDVFRKPDGLYYRRKHRELQVRCSSIEHNTFYRVKFELESDLGNKLSFFY